MSEFHRLFVWEESIELAVQILALAEELAARKRFAVADQIVRAAFSVASNIAEGQGRATTADRRRFFVQSRGSLYELETQLEILRRALIAKDVSGVHTRIKKISSGLSRIIAHLDDSKTRRL